MFFFAKVGLFDYKSKVLFRGAPSMFQRVGSKKNSILHSGADPENFGGGMKF